MNRLLARTDDLLGFMFGVLLFISPLGIMICLVVVTTLGRIHLMVMVVFLVILFPMAIWMTPAATRVIRECPKANQ